MEISLQSSYMMCIRVGFIDFVLQRKEYIVDINEANK